MEPPAERVYRAFDFSCAPVADIDDLDWNHVVGIGQSAEGSQGMSYHNTHTSLFRELYALLHLTILLLPQSCLV